MSKDEFDYPLLDLIRDYVGEAVADKIQREFGGTTISLPTPKGLTRDHELSKLLGFETAPKVCRETTTSKSAGKQAIPMGDYHGAAALIRSRKREAVKLLAEGISVKQIARRLRCNERTIWRYKAEIKKMNGDRVLPLLAKGKTIQEVVQFLGLSLAEVTAIHKHLKSQGKLQC